MPGSQGLSDPLIQVLLHYKTALLLLVFSYGPHWVWSSFMEENGSVSSQPSL